jgi:hypothetical protein
MEKSFSSLYPIDKIKVDWSAQKDEISFAFVGSGFVLRGETAKWQSNSSYNYEAEVYIDSVLSEKIVLPANYTTRRHEICWNYNLPHGNHKVRVKILNPSKEEIFIVREAIVYSDTSRSKK